MIKSILDYLKSGSKSKKTDTIKKENQEMSKENDMMIKKQKLIEAKKIIKEKTLFTRSYKAALRKHEQLRSKCFLLAIDTPPDGDYPASIWQKHKDQGDYVSAAFYSFDKVMSEEREKNPIIFPADPYPHLSSREFHVAYSMMKGRKYSEVEGSTFHRLKEYLLLEAILFFLEDKMEARKLTDEMMEENLKLQQAALKR